jgi:riboflavin kinase / FMN adenylyltransferase
MDLRVEALSRRETLFSPPRRVVAIGNFDGIHRGHQELLVACVIRAREKDALATVLTFYPHPGAVVSKSGAPPRILTRASRRRLLAELGIDEIATLSFDAEVSRLSPEEFVEAVLVRELRSIVVVVGEGFRFGAARAGDGDRLKAIGAATFETIEVPTLEDASGHRVSSSRVRGALEAGDLESARVLLGRPYEIEGRVIHGDHRGRDLGYPTANIELDGVDALPNGIYAADVFIEEEPVGHRAAVSLGTRPTFHGVDRRLEAHILDFDQNLYGRAIRVRFLARLRGEERFDSVQALRDQIARDVEAAALAVGVDAHSG